MPETRRTNAAAPAPEHRAEPVEMTWNETPFFGCPFCGHNRQDKDLVQQHIDACPRGEP